MNTIKKINQYDILAELQEQNKNIKICKVTAHIGIKGNNEVDKAAKNAIDMPGMTTTTLSYTHYYLTIRRARNFKWQVEANYTTSNHALKSGKVPTTVVGNMRLS